MQMNEQAASLKKPSPRTVENIRTSNQRALAQHEAAVNPFTSWRNGDRLKAIQAASTALERTSWNPTTTIAASTTLPLPQLAKHAALSPSPPPPLVAAGPHPPPSHTQHLILPNNNNNHMSCGTAPVGVTRRGGGGGGGGAAYRYHDVSYLHDGYQAPLSSSSGERGEAVIGASSSSGAVPQPQAPKEQHQKVQSSFRNANNPVLDVVTPTASKETSSSARKEYELAWNRLQDYVTMPSILQRYESIGESVLPYALQTVATATAPKQQSSLHRSGPQPRLFPAVSGAAAVGKTPSTDVPSGWPNAELRPLPQPNNNNTGNPTTTATNPTANGARWTASYDTTKPPSRADAVAVANVLRTLLQQVEAFWSPLSAQSSDSQPQQQSHSAVLQSVFHRHNNAASDDDDDEEKEEETRQQQQTSRGKKSSSSVPPPPLKKQQQVVPPTLVLPLIEDLCRSTEADDTNVSSSPHSRATNNANFPDSTYNNNNNNNSLPSQLRGADPGEVRQQLHLLDRLCVLDCCFSELIRQVKVHCVERGALLNFIRETIFSFVGSLIRRANDAKHEVQVAQAAVGEAQEAQLHTALLLEESKKQVETLQHEIRRFDLLHKYQTARRVRLREKLQARGVPLWKMPGGGGGGGSGGKDDDDDEQGQSSMGSFPSGSDDAFGEEEGEPSDSLVVDRSRSSSNRNKRTKKGAATTSSAQRTNKNNKKNPLGTSTSRTTSTSGRAQQTGAARGRSNDARKSHGSSWNVGEEDELDEDEEDLLLAQEELLALEEDYGTDSLSQMIQKQRKEQQKVRRESMAAPIATPSHFAFVRDRPQRIKPTVRVDASVNTDPVIVRSYRKAGEPPLPPHLASGCSSPNTSTFSGAGGPFPHHHHVGELTPMNHPLGGEGGGMLVTLPEVFSSSPFAPPPSTATSILRKPRGGGVEVYHVACQADIDLPSVTTTSETLGRGKSFRRSNNSSANLKRNNSTTSSSAVDASRRKISLAAAKTLRILKPSSTSVEVQATVGTLTAGCQVGGFGIPVGTQTSVLMLMHVSGAMQGGGGVGAVSSSAGPSALNTPFDAAFSPASGVDVERHGSAQTSSLLTGNAVHVSLQCGVSAVDPYASRSMEVQTNVSMGDDLPSLGGRGGGGGSSVNLLSRSGVVQWAGSTTHTSPQQNPMTLDASLLAQPHHPHHPNDGRSPSLSPPAGRGAGVSPGRSPSTTTAAAHARSSTLTATSALLASHARSKSPQANAARPPLSVRAPTTTSTAPSPVVPKVRIPTHAPTNAVEMLLTSARLDMSKTKIRPPKWVLSQIMQIHCLMLREGGFGFQSGEDVSVVLLQHFKSQYGVDKVAERYVADFLASAGALLQPVVVVTSNPNSSSSTSTPHEPTSNPLSRLPSRSLLLSEAAAPNGGGGGGSNTFERSVVVSSDNSNSHLDTTLGATATTTTTTLLTCPYRRLHMFLQFTNLTSLYEGLPREISTYHTATHQFYLFLLDQFRSRASRAFLKELTEEATVRVSPQFARTVLTQALEGRLLPPLVEAFVEGVTALLNLQMLQRMTAVQREDWLKPFPPALQEYIRGNVLSRLEDYSATAAAPPATTSLSVLSPFQQVWWDHKQGPQQQQQPALRSKRRRQIFLSSKSNAVRTFPDALLPFSDATPPPTTTSTTTTTTTNKPGVSATSSFTGMRRAERHQSIVSLLLLPTATTTTTAAVAAASDRLNHSSSSRDPSTASTTEQREEEDERGGGGGGGGLELPSATALFQFPLEGEEPNNNNNNNNNTNNNAVLAAPRQPIKAVSSSASYSSTPPSVSSSSMTTFKTTAPASETALLSKDEEQEEETGAGSGTATRRLPASFVVSEWAWTDLDRLSVVFWDLDMLLDTLVHNFDDLFSTLIEVTTRGRT